MFVPTEEKLAVTKVTSRNPWAWVSTTYLAEGLPYVIVMTVAVIVYKGLGISNTDIALYTGWLYLPWVIKPFWSPVVDILKTKRVWIWVMELVLGAGLGGVALTLPGPNAFRYSLAFLWLIAFSSATHDIAIDGFYLLATTEKEQSFFVGVRSTFYRIAMICGQGLLVILAGVIQNHTGLPQVELHVSATPGAALVQSVNPGPTAAQTPGELRVVVQPDRVNIDPQPRTKTEVASLLDSVKAGNTANGFYGTEQKTAGTNSWSNRWFFNPVGNFFYSLGGPVRWPATRLELFLRKYFGQTKTQSGVAGNVGIVSLHLSRPPGREVVVTLGSKVGFGLGGGADKSFSVAEGGRLSFNDQNWNQPALAVIQLDPRVRTAAETTMEIRSGNIPLSWSITFAALALLFLLFSVYHKIILPYPVKDKPGDARTVLAFLREFLRTFGAFFAKEKIGFLLLFLLFYRFAEAQLVRMAVPFLLDPRESGGLGLTTAQVGLAYGTVGVIALTCGGLLGGMVAAKNGLKFWIWWMVLAIHLPDAVFLYLSHTMPDNFWVINLCVAIEQFGYGFGFTAYMLYMIYIARGDHPTAHYAICTGFMALGMMVPGMFSGWLQDIIGYKHFFVWVLLATIPGFLVVLLIPLDSEFGKKTNV
jgi:PAT family beta-lactamase induction signal transducer AmpG